MEIRISKIAVLKGKAKSRIPGSNRRKIRDISYPGPDFSLPHTHTHLIGIHDGGLLRFHNFRIVLRLVFRFEPTYKMSQNEKIRSNQVILGLALASFGFKLATIYNNFFLPISNFHPVSVDKKIEKIYS